jgi:hypothetical protein
MHPEPEILKHHKGSEKLKAKLPSLVVAIAV